jgi:Natural resistance-associated macrophage protein
VGCEPWHVFLKPIHHRNAFTLFRAGKTDTQSATEAAQALASVAGRSATTLPGAGMLAVPVLTGSSAYAQAETFGWKYGLDEKPHRAPRFYLTIAVATLVGMLLNFSNVSAFLDGSVERTACASIARINDVGFDQSEGHEGSSERTCSHPARLDQSVTQSCSNTFAALRDAREWIVTFWTLPPFVSIDEALWLSFAQSIRSIISSTMRFLSGR